MRYEPRGPWFSVKRAAEYLGIPVHTLNKLRSIGGGPRFAKRGRNVHYCYEWCDEWLTARAARSTSDYGVAPDRQTVDAGQGN
jgi:hypothetical protein